MGFRKRARIVVLLPLLAACHQEAVSVGPTASTIYVLSESPPRLTTYGGDGERIATFKGIGGTGIAIGNGKICITRNATKGDLRCYLLDMTPGTPVLNGGGKFGIAMDSAGYTGRVQAPADDGELITYSGDGHIMTFAPTGTGKTSGPVICNALDYPGQLIVLDIKGEVHAATARRRREMGQEVHVLDLRDGGEAGSLNPLDLAVRGGSDPGAIARSFAADVIERGADEKDRFWNDWAETMITGGGAWLIEDCPPEERCLSRLFDLLTVDDTDYGLAVLLDKKPKARAAYKAFAAYLQLPERETRPSVLGTQMRYPVLDPEAYHDARLVAPGYDVYYLEQEWRDWWVESGMPEFHAAGKAFVAFCKQRHQRRPNP